VQLDSLVLVAEFFTVNLVLMSLSKIKFGFCCVVVALPLINQSKGKTIKQREKTAKQKETGMAAKVYEETLAQPFATKSNMNGCWLILLCRQRKIKLTITVAC
jgi:hypothetical protein